ncbi:DNK domain-containing protein [Naegleria gruberi]|uniref:DNK domain-containing protein n=1 Tax=Naegleria gruberi TaxID=5762 RepID=D2V179_NAEGR|nr:DNK domain-containing protein [Naegleria gruberi]EFC49262.1 DNK domain-containing protein [Naegleria gruberi]|eukprot:XP_002682006.1 DNK domain-containing protein [Naegleria gruberi strain NEG-M]
MEQSSHNSLQAANRLVCFVEGNIGSGKSTTVKELQLFNDNSVSEQQKTEEWTLLSKYYEGGMKNDLTLNYELQKQIANTYFKHYFKYSFLPHGGVGIGDLFDDKTLQSMMKKHEKYLRIHPNTKLPETISLPSTSSQPTQPSSSNVYNIFFEGILSSSGVFTVMEYNKGMIREEDYVDLCKNYDALQKGVTGHMAFYLKPTNNVDVCLERIKVRRREFESVIEKPYLKTIEEHYDCFMDKVATKIPVFVIDNSTMDAKETAALILDVLSAVRKDIKYM